MASKLALFLFLTLSCSVHLLVSSFEFQVGGSNGWVVPPANDTRIYNDWASENRFQIDDTVRFKYRKDSVMEVSEQDYKNCNSTHPNFFSNTGNTVFRFSRPGAFYFISGVSGHCQKGQRMIVKVMMSHEYENPPPPEGHPRKSSAHSISVDSSSGLLNLVLVQFVFSYVASCLF
ncbi:hypothetical protein SLA2020_077740 [Shorea laevis]